MFIRYASKVLCILRSWLPIGYKQHVSKAFRPCYRLTDKSIMPMMVRAITYHAKQETCALHWQQLRTVFMRCEGMQAHTQMAAIRRDHTSVAAFADSGVLMEAWSALAGLPVDFVDLVVMNSSGGGVFCLVSKDGVGFFSTTFNSLPCASLMPVLQRSTTPPM